MIHQGEIVGLLVAVFLTPVALVSFRTVRVVGRPWFLLGYMSVVAGSAFRVAEAYSAPGLFGLLEHLSYLCAGVGFLGGAWAVLVFTKGWLQR